MDEKELYVEYREWFRNKFGTYPEWKYHGISMLTDMLDIRDEFKNPESDILDYKKPEEIERILNKVEVLTFEEYKNYHYE